ncbi:hypothetical protein Dimus_015931 [Dionaea muscipula]
MREGLGSEEVVVRPDLPDFVVVVAPCEDLVPSLPSEPDLIASPEEPALTMAEALSSIGLAGRGREEVLALSLASGVLSDDGGSEEMVADLPELVSAAAVFSGVPVMKVVDGDVLQEISEGSSLVRSDSCALVSPPSSSCSRLAGFQGDVSVVRGREAVVGQAPSVLMPVVSVQSVSGDGQALGMLTDWLGALLADDIEVFSAVDTAIDGGCVREDARVSSTAITY